VDAIFGGCCGARCCREVRVEAIIVRGTIFEGSCAGLRKGLLAFLDLEAGLMLLEAGSFFATFN